MTAPFEVRPAQEHHLAGVCDIVNHYIRTTAYNFRTEPQTPQQWREQWRADRQRYPWLVAVAGDQVRGVAYASAWKERAAYAWSAEVTGYVAPDARRCGLGRALYQRLLGTLDAQGFRTTIAGISLPNPASVALHESFGFTHVGTFESVGFKLDRWCDVGYWQRLNPTAAQLVRPVGPGGPG